MFQRFGILASLPLQLVCILLRTSATNALTLQRHNVSHEVAKVNFTSVANSTNARGQEPQLIFLFLVYNKINNEEIWGRFFRPAIQGSDFRALVHCKDTTACRRNIRAPHIFEIIPAVETKYCTDLVSGMNALLQAGITYAGQDGHPNDKFIFISDSTLPVKPFHFVQQRLLSQGTNSNFCIFPRNEWAEIQETTPGLLPYVRAAVKHHQWMILSRAHAGQVMKRSHEYRNLMTTFHINSIGLPDGKVNTGCLDEFWHFAILFGTISHASNPQMMQLSGLSGRPLSTTDYEIQGQCDTFVQWVPRASGTANNMTSLMQALASDPGVDMTPPSDKRPATMHRFSQTALKHMRDSWFLFARKVDDGAGFAGCSKLVDVFDKLIFSEPPQPLEALAPWRGQGMWIDTRGYPVTIVSTDGSIRLLGQGSGMDAKGIYCQNRLEVVFANGYRSAAQLSPDGNMLAWDTGVSWHRSV